MSCRFWEENEAAISLRIKGRKTAPLKNEAITLLKKSQLQETIEMRFCSDKMSVFGRAETLVCSGGIGAMRMKIPGQDRKNNPRSQNH
jgi:hypothetical protein